MYVRSYHIIAKTGPVSSESKQHLNIEFSLNFATETPAAAYFSLRAANLRSSKAGCMSLEHSS